MSAETLYRVTEVAALWRCSREHVYEQIRRRRLRTVNISTTGRARIRIPESALKAFVEARASGTEPPAGPQQPPSPTRPRTRRAAA